MKGDVGEVLGREEKIDISKQEPGTVFQVEIKCYSNGILRKGTMEVIDPKKKELRFQLERSGGIMEITTREIDNKLKEGGAIAGSVPVGILRSFEIQKKEE